MAETEAHAILEPAATRVRDPLSGRSVWVSQMIHDAQLEDDVLRFTLACREEHSPEDRDRMRAALERRIESVGWRGKVVCQVIVASSAPRPAPLLALSLAAGRFGREEWVLEALLRVGAP